MRLRYQIVLALLGSEQYPRLLEIGYGSGVFLPELARHCDELHGLDIHDRQAAVAEVLARARVRANLVSASMTAMPFEDHIFDSAVAVSSLEFVDDLDAACREVKRVLRPGGAFVVVTPGSSPLVDFGLKVLTGKSAKADFGDRRQRVIPTLLRHFGLQKRRTAPRFGTFLFHLYTGLRLSVGLPS
jgi:ubiquinone/menaquinone biosynthesis C-methylase UbiE